MQLPPNDFFVFDEPQAAGTLVGRVSRTLSEEEVTQVCEWMLEAAEVGRKQYWLLDIRRDPETKSVALTQWMAEQFLPRAVEVVGCSICLAYVFDPTLFKELREQELLDQWHMSTPACRLSFFTEEAAAFAWLARVREADNKSGRLPLTGRQEPRC